MSDANLYDFQNRVRRISKAKKRLSRGAIIKIRSDGQLVEVPRPRRISLPWMQIVSLILAAIVVKGMFLSHLGPSTYEWKVSALQSGSTIEQASAWLLQPDPATIWVADLIERLNL